VVLQTAMAANWAVIVAGSNQFYNYRHQSDACHAFQITSKNGVPPENTIVMVFDDIANDPSNPYPGQIFNKPTATGTPGVNVYAGCQKDYTGDDVTASNFLSVLTGNATAVPAGKKVLQSKAGDHVFVFFTDHGGVGILAFPTGPFLMVADLNAALVQMHNSQMFNKLVFYVEACEAGSMFEGVLPDNINIYVTTASNADESSWGTYCPPDDSVNGLEIGSCLGDLYSVSWMEDADRSGSMSESLETQYNTVKAETTQSHVMQYGELDWDTLPIGQFEGGSSANRSRVHHRMPVMRTSNVDSRDAKLSFLYNRYLRAKNSEESLVASELVAAEMTERAETDALFTDFARAVVADTAISYSSVLSEVTDASPIECHECCGALFETVRTQCGGWSDYALKYTRTIVNACSLKENTAEGTESLLTTMRGLCL